MTIMRKEYQRINLNIHHKNRPKKPKPLKPVKVYVGAYDAKTLRLLGRFELTARRISLIASKSKYKWTSQETKERLLDRRVIAGSLSSARLGLDKRDVAWRLMTAK